MNMFKPTDAKNIEQYIAMLTDERRTAIEFLDDLIRKTVPNLHPFFASNMLGYDEFKYTNYKKKEAYWPIIALASQKNYMSLYVCAVADGKYLAEGYATKLGKVDVGKSCIRFKRLEDLNIEGVAEVLQEAERFPGLVAANANK